MDTNIALTPAQQEMWVSMQLVPSQNYNIAGYVEFFEEIDPVIFQDSCNRLIDDITCLNTSFKYVENVIKQNTSHHRKNYTFIDLSKDDDPLATAHKTIQQDAYAQLDIEKDCLHNFILFKISKDYFLFYKKYHHIIIDGVSGFDLIERIIDIYRHKINHLDVPPLLSGTISEYLEMEKIYENSEQKKKSRAFWQDYLSDWQHPGSIFDQLPRAAHDMPRQKNLVLPVEQREACASFMEVHGCHFSTFSIACIAAYLHAVTKQDDLVLTLPVTGRTRQTRKTYTFQSNIVPLRLSLSAEMSFNDIVRVVSHSIRKIVKHTHIRGEQIARDVLPKGSASFGPTVNIIDFHKDFKLSQSTARYNNILFGPIWDLAFCFQKNPSSGPEDFSIVIDKPLNAAQTCDLNAVSDQISWFINQFILYPNQPLKEIESVSSNHKKNLLETWQNREGFYPVSEEKCIHHFFEDHAEQRPHATALIYKNRCVTYKSLNERANYLAKNLIALGVGPESRVGLCVERSIETAIAILAILKAGGAYVPLDPSSASSRLKLILSDAQPDALIVDNKGKEYLGESINFIDKKINISEYSESDLLEENVKNNNSSSDLAYIIYTSGSTGTPKGVMIEHKNITRLFDNTSSWFDFNHHDVWCLFHSYAFDFSVWEFWGALRYGGALVIVPPAIAKDSSEFYDLLCEHNVTVLNQTPSAFKVLLDNVKNKSEHSLRYIIFGGEALEPSILNKWYKIHNEKSPKIINMYGITETTVHVTYRHITCNDLNSNVSPIGTNIPDLSIYILDADQKLVPPGIVGEMYVGGGGVARGYLNRPDLTAERFLADPFVDDPSARMYRSGDLARFLPNGEIEYLGRADQQVKIRGFRIEPGEIEARLLEYPTVKAAAVIAREDSPGDKRLVGYVVGEPDATLDMAEIRRHLGAVLPDYMVPSMLVAMDALPLTSNGKLDRKALPAPQVSLKEAGRAPRTPQEESVAALFAEILGLPSVSIDDSFFDLGGHSLLATRLVSRLRSQCDGDLSVRSIFEHPTVAELCAALNTTGGVSRPALTVRERPSVLPLSFAQQRLWFLFQLEGPSATYNIPLAMHLHGNLRADVLETALSAIVARHESLRTVFPEVDGVACQAILPSEDPRCVVRLERSEASAAELDEHLKGLAQTAIDLTNELPLRAFLVTLSPTHHVLLVLFHHIASDGWSIAPFVRDLSAAYKAGLHHERPFAEGLPVQYADYTLWQRDLLGDERDAESIFHQQVVYWREALSGIPSCIELPTDRSRPAVSAYQGRSLTFEIGRDLSEGLQDLSRATGTSVFMVMQAALAILLNKLGGGDDIVIGSPIAGRTETALEQLVGFFVNTLVLRTRLADNPTIEDILQQVRDTNLSAYSHQELPFEKLVEVLNPARTQNYHPLFQVMLTYENASDAALDLSGVTAHMHYVQNTVAKFDLTFGFSETAHGLDGVIEYDTALFDESTVQAMSARYVQILREMVAHRDAPLSEVSILTGAERRLLLETWNDTQAPFPEEQCIHELFEAQVLRSPAAPAVVFEGQSLSYDALNRRANQLAHHLVALGITPDMPVAVCLDRSAEVMICLLAILKAGGVYLPLDPAYPTSRLHYILEDAAPGLVLVDDIGAQALGADVLQRVKMMNLHHDCAAWQDCAETNLPLSEVGLKAQSGAYIIYTSGSTGKPKGAIVEHRNVIHLAITEHKFFHPSSDSRVLQFASYSFDASFFEIILAMHSGASLYLLSSQQRSDLNVIWDMMHENKITHAMFPPAIFQFREQLRNLPSLKFIMLAGEALDLTTVKFLSESVHATIVNVYGPTEATVWACGWACPHHIDDLTVVPIGRPLANTRIYMLDAYQRLVPPGIVGELYIGGSGVTRGYLNRPDLTAERFLADPFVDDPSARMYRSGDLARFLPNGEIEYLGRADQQVKIRGFRIEPGEIEARLLEYPTVKAAAVIAREDSPGDKRLVGYVVGEPDATLDMAEIRRHLGAVLPDYMVPSMLVAMDALPLTSNGKLDRKALPAPQVSLKEAGRAPRTPQEESVAALFAEILGLPSVSIDDSFFDLGGHSLLATRLVSRLRSQCDGDLSVRSIFEHPTVAELCAALNTTGGVSRPALTVRERPSVLPLSFAQQRLWFLFQLEGPSATYNIPLAMHLHGNLRADVLETALSAIVARHESLRTVFPEVDGVACQAILPSEDPRCVVRLERSEASAAELDEHLKGLAQTAIDLTNELPLRAFLVTLSPTHHVLLVLFHHIASDGWSIAPFVRDLSAAYKAGLHHERPFAEGLPVQYADYTLWQRDLLGDERDAESIFHQQVVYWREALSGIPSCIELPTDRSRPAVSAYQGRSLTFEIGRDLSEGLQDLSRATGTSVFMVMQAALAILLNKLGGGDDIVIGSPIAGRTETALEQLVGFFVNTLVLRTRLADNPTIEDILQQVRDTNLSAYSHQELPFEKLVEVLNPARTQNYHPLFQVMLTYENASDAALDLSGVTAHMHYVQNTVAKFDLTFAISETKNGLVGGIEYDTALFDESTVQAMSARYVQILREMVAHRDAPLSEVSILTGAERRLLLETWNDTQAPFPEEQCIHELFEAQVLRSPDAPAVVFEGQSLSYDALNRRANQLAHHLVTLGITPDMPVAVCLDRGFEMVVCLFAILKAGGAYIPLDPSYPVSRLHYILEDAKPRLVFVDQSGASALGDDVLQTATVLDVHHDCDVWKGYADTNISPASVQLTSHNLAYIIYTSGSTGRPKGVPNEHRAIVDRLIWIQNSYQLSADDAVIQKTPASFDISVWEFFWTPITGARLVVAKPEGHKDPVYLANLIEEENITTINFVPSMLEHFLEYEEAKKCTSLRRILCCGEALPLNVVKKSREYLPDATVYNLYGPTEAAVDVTDWKCPEDASALSMIPIGRPIANTRIYILDAYQKLVPPGVVGELYIGGGGVARGYLNRPDLTAECFVADPFVDDPSARMYRSGDLARFLPNGEIEYLGRADQQVKIRGFRIEPGEIEARLLEYPTVKAAAVIAREDSPGDKRLVGYVVGEPDATLDMAEIRRHLGAVLPDYMVPSMLVAMDALPLTSNGKLDRKALPAPQVSLKEAGRAPRTPQEESVAALFAEILGLPSVSIDDSFFDLGGHSLLATRLVSRLRSQCDGDLSVRSIFEHPTVAELCAALNTTGGVSRPALTVRERPSVLPLSFAQQRLWFLFQLEGPSATYNIPLAMHLHGNLRADVLETALSAIVARHESLRTVFPEVDGVACQAILPSEDPRCVVRLERSEASAAELDEHLKGLAQTAIDLTNELPLRAFLVTLSPTHHVLLVLFHHIASDGWSIAPFVRDLSAAYKAGLHHERPFAEGLPVQYADYTLWQRDLLGDERDAESIFHQQVVYWREALSGIPSCIELPTDRSRPAVSAYQGRSLTFEIGRDLSEGLQDLSRTTGTSVFMVMQAALAILLNKLGGGDDIVIGSPIAGRTETALEQLVGFFVNTLVLRTRLADNPTIEDILQQVRDTNLSAYSHQELPFEKLVEVLNPARTQNYHPLFQVMLTYENASDAALDLSGVTAHMHYVQNTVAKFDLTFGFSETAHGLDGVIEYDTALFDESTVQAMSARYVQILREMVAHRDAPLSEVSILTGAERRLLLETWNDTQAPFPEEQCIHELFEAQVLRSPDAPAVVFEGQSLSYDALNRRANQLAHHLVALGITPDMPVAVCLDRSAEVMICLLAILKAGGVYLPLDPAYPTSRLHYILEDAAPGLVLVDDIGAQALGADVLQRVKMMNLHHDCAAWQDCAETNLPLSEVGLKAQSGAYIIYTSGSTGKPKGTVVEHRNVIHLAVTEQKLLHPSSDSRVLQFASYSFDASIFEIILAMHSGASLYLLSSQQRSDLNVIWDIMCENKITHAMFPPAMFQFKETLRNVPSLKFIMFGGDVLDINTVKFVSECVDATIVNAYGPTEATVWGTAWVCPERIDTGSIVPIGRSLANTRVYLLDAYQNLVPPGAVGELYIGGSGVTRGYLNRPDLTAERFLADPFVDDPSARMYRSGDLARFLPNGEIEYLGRADQQVKIRGFRIEPGEIEARLLEYPTVKAAAVIAREDSPGDKRLVGYVVGEPDATLDMAEIRRHLGAVLPDYMVPSMLVAMDALPLTSNGKLDRKALPAPQVSLKEAGRAPRTPQEESVAALFAEILGLPSVSIDDSFFDLGGHSLLATRLISRLRSQLQSDIPVRSIFENPTVAGLVEYLREGKRSDSNLVALRKSGSLSPLFCIHGGYGLAWPYRNLLPALNPQRPVYAFNARGLEPNEPIPQSMDALVDDYIEQMKKVQPKGPYCILGWSFGAVAAHAIAARLQREGDDIEHVILLDGYPSYQSESIVAADDQNEEAFDEILRQYNVESIDQGMKENLLATSKNNMTMLYNYHPETFKGGMLFIQAVNSDNHSLGDPSEWKAYVNGSIKTEILHSEHSHMMDEKNAEIISEILNKYM